MSQMPSLNLHPTQKQNVPNFVHRTKQTENRPAKTPRQAEYSFGEYGFKHRAQWVFWPSPSSGERTQWVPLILLYVCVPSRTHRVFRRTHRVCRKTQWGSVSSLLRNSTLETVVCPFHQKNTTFSKSALPPKKKQKKMPSVNFWKGGGGVRCCLHGVRNFALWTKLEPPFGNHRLQSLRQSPLGGKLQARIFFQAQPPSLWILLLADP